MSILAVEVCAVQQLDRDYSQRAMKPLAINQLVASDTRAVIDAHSKSNYTGVRFAQTKKLSSSDVQGTKLEYELRVDMHPVPVVNKVILVLLEVSLLGCCGVDRCYLGSVWSGVIKGVTCGGFFLWGFMDFLAIMFNCFFRADHIHVLGLEAKFRSQAPSGPDDVTVARYVAFGASILYCGLVLRTRRKKEVSTESSGSPQSESSLDSGADQSRAPVFQADVPPPAA